MSEHTDNYADKTKHANQDRVDTFHSFNSESTEDCEISHPGNGRREVELEKPLLVAMARANRYDPDDVEINEDTIFDEALCEVADLALKSADLTEPRPDLHKLRALMIHISWGIDHFADLKEHISSYSKDEIQKFGLNREYEKSTYRKAAKQLKKTQKFELLIDATYIAVHAVFWNGVPIPEKVKTKYNVSYDAGPEASDFPPIARMYALYNLVEQVLEIVTSQLEEHWDVSTSNNLRSLIGVFAQSAYGDGSIETYHESAQHSFNLNNVFPASTLRYHIDKLKRSTVETIFDNVNRALLRYTLGSGVVSEPLLAAYDLVYVESLGIEDFGDQLQTADGRWRFGQLSLTDPDLEFGFGFRLLRSKRARTAELENLLSNLTAEAEVRLLLADRGFDGRNDIVACRKMLSNKKQSPNKKWSSNKKQSSKEEQPSKNWIICAQDYSDTDPDSDSAQLREQIEPGGSTVVENAGFNNLNPPVKLIGYSGASENDDSPDPIRAFYANHSLPIPDDPKKRDSFIQDINFTYNQRAKIETLFRLIKNEFDVGSDTDKPNRKVFYFNISVLFYNIYKIVNTVPSPRYGLEFDVSQKELLEVVRILSFGGVQQPDAYTYFNNHK